MSGKHGVSLVAAVDSRGALVGELHPEMILKKKREGLTPSNIDGRSNKASPSLTRTSTWRGWIAPQTCDTRKHLVADAAVLVVGIGDGRRRCTGSSPVIP
jgi:hypothetical protein